MRALPYPFVPWLAAAAACVTMNLARGRAAGCERGVLLAGDPRTCGRTRRPGSRLTGARTDCDTVEGLHR